MAEAERVRLHITPFNPDLLDRYIPPSLKSQVSNISFHTIETFPERGFGYLELPAMEAQKLKNKLNGSSLKGAKVKIEEAKPQKKRKSTDSVEDVEDDKKSRKKARKEKAKSEKGVTIGHELEDGRHIKRGWTEDKSAKKSKKAEKSSLEGKKMKFKTEVPPNKASIEKDGKKSKIKEKKEKKDKDKAGKKPAVVKEFSRTTKLSAIGVNGKDAIVAPTSYEEGVGWVDEDGNVVEPEPSSKRRKRTADAAKALGGKRRSDSEPAAKKSPEPTEEAEDLASNDESSLESEDEVPSVIGESSESSESSKSEDDLDRQLHEAKNNTASNAAVERERAHSIALPTAGTDDTQKEVHPLEALYKRPAVESGDAGKAKKPAPIDTSFSFFGAGGDGEDEVMTEDSVPQTPHTKQDLEWRRLRSAAPTPDTAAIGKRFDFSFAENGDGTIVEDHDEEGDDVEMDDVPSLPTQAGAARKENEDKEESEFRKWFYENRGDLNRAWKKRRREERKIVRQRENRKLGLRIA